MNEYGKVKAQLKKKYRNKWFDYLRKGCRYKSPHFVFLNEALSTDSDDELYVLPAFLAPGEHAF